MHACGGRRCAFPPYLLAVLLAALMAGGSVDGYAAGATAAAPQFALTLDQFKEKFNAAAKARGMEGIVSEMAAKGSGSVSLLLDDAAFQKRVQAFRKANLAKGHALLKTRIDIALSGDGKVRQVTVGGERADLVNAFQLIDTMGVVALVLNPALPPAKLRNLLGQFGMMQGDDFIAATTAIAKLAHPSTPPADLAALTASLHRMHGNNGESIEQPVTVLNEDSAYACSGQTSGARKFSCAITPGS